MMIYLLRLLAKPIQMEHFTIHIPLFPAKRKLHSLGGVLSAPGM